MTVEKFDFKDTSLFSQLFIDYVNKNPSLKPYFNNFPDDEGFLNQIKTRKLSQHNRAVLADQLALQYKNPDSIVSNNIESLRDEKTFTITTGHQLNIFTGPLYFIYKIITVINACKELHAKHPSYKFVPVYWMASEDHDFEEISYFKMLGEKYTWETDQTGAVGRMDPRSIKGILDQMPGDHQIFRDAYLEHDNLSDAVRHYVNALFGNEGLVVIDADDHKLKELFNDVLIDELVNNSASGLVADSTKKLESLGFKPPISAREINLFYLDDSVRERIVQKEGKFQVLNTEISFSKSDITDLAKNEPEKLSPNVILRPLYQEVILPNLAYVGGPAEVVYWLQLKGIFDHYGVSFPILLPRNFVLYIDHVAKRKMEQSGAETADALMSRNEIFKKLVSLKESGEVKFDKELEAINKFFDEFNTIASGLDPTLSQLVEAEKKRTGKSVDKIAQKANRAIRRQHKDLENQVGAWFDALNPGGGIQERTLNFLHFAIDNPDFIRMIAPELSPFDLRYHVITNV